MFNKDSVEVSPSKRQDLFKRKLVQCQILFDFSDPSSDLKNKDIKRQELQDILEYIAAARGAVTDAIYPDMIQMVKKERKIGLQLGFE